MIWQNTKPPLGSKINWSHPLSKGITSCYLFNEGMGNLVYDLSLNRKVGWFMGIDQPASSTSGWNTGKFGKSIKFPETNASGIATNSYPLTGLSQFTISFWYYMTARPAAARIVMCQGSPGYFPNPFVINTNSVSGTQDGFVFRLVNNLNQVINVVTYNYLNQWVHQLYTYDGTQMKVYINGKYTTAGNLNAPICSVNYNLSIAGNFDGYLGMNVSIDHAIFWNRYLDPAEQMKLHTEPFCFIN